MKLRKSFVLVMLLASLLISVPAQAAGVAGVPTGYYVQVYGYRIPVSYGWPYYQVIFRTLPSAPATVPTAPPGSTPGTVPAPPPAPNPQPVPVSGQADQYERQVLDLVNARRAEAGVSPLAWDAGLAGLARTKSADMRDQNYFGHQSPTLGSAFDMMRRAGLSYRYAGENIAAGQKTPAAVVEGWMNSPGHRANILNPRFTRLGVGFAAGGSYGTYWTQMFIGD